MATRNALLALCLMPYLASALLVQPKALQLRELHLEVCDNICLLVFLRVNHIIFSKTFFLPPHRERWRFERSRP